MDNINAKDQNGVSPSDVLGGQNERLVMCESIRDKLLAKLWCVFREMSDLQSPDAFTDEDLEMWEKVTKHSGIQSKLRT